MTPDEFEEIISRNRDLLQPLRNVVAAIPARVLESLDTSTEIATIVNLFPVIARIVKEIGFPWQFSPKQYTELWHEKFRPWIEGQYSEYKLHPYAVESSGNALRKELEGIKDLDIRDSWQHLAMAMKKKRESEGED